MGWEQSRTGAYRAACSELELGLRIHIHTIARYLPSAYQRQILEVHEEKTGMITTHDAVSMPYVDNLWSAGST